MAPGKGKTMTEEALTLAARPPLTQVSTGTMAERKLGWMTCVCVCVCVCAHACACLQSRMPAIAHACECACVPASVRACVPACVCEC